MRRPSSRGSGAPLAALVATVLVAAGALVVGGGSTGAQTTGTQTAGGSGSETAPAPVAIVEPVASTGSLPPPLDVVALSATAEEGALRVTLELAEPFTVPDEGYRLSVSVGDPLGQRSRASLVGADGATGAVSEVGNGLTFREPTPTTVEVGEATVELVVPAEDVGPGAAVWVDGELTDGDGEVTTSSSGYFAYDALVGRSIDGAAPGGTWGWTTTATGLRFADPVLVGGAPLTVATRNRVVAVDAVDPAPETLLGQPVATADAYLGIRLSGASSPELDGAVLIDRTNGEVSLLDGTGTPVPGTAPGDDDRSWVVEDLAGPVADGPFSVAIDPEALAAVLGAPFDPSTFAVELTAAYALDDARVVTVSGVATTLAWLDQVAGEVPASTTTTSAGVVVVAPDDETAFPLLPALATGAGVLLAVGVLAAVLGRRRGRSRGEPVEEPPPAEPILDLRTAASVPHEGPATAAEPAPGAAAAEAPELPEPVPAADPRSPDQVLAVFEAELAALSARVDRLDPRSSGRDRRTS